MTDLGFTPDPAWVDQLTRQIAMVSEGFCPWDSGRLIPSDHPDRHIPHHGWCPNCGRRLTATSEGGGTLDEYWTEDRWQKAR